MSWRILLVTQPLNESGSVLIPILVLAAFVVPSLIASYALGTAQESQVRILKDEHYNRARFQLNGMAHRAIPIILRDSSFSSCTDNSDCKGTLETSLMSAKIPTCSSTPSELCLSKAIRKPSNQLQIEAEARQTYLGHSGTWRLTILSEFQGATSGSIESKYGFISTGVSGCTSTRIYVTDSGRPTGTNCVNDITIPSNPTLPTTPAPPEYDATISLASNNIKEITSYIKNTSLSFPCSTDKTNKEITCSNTNKINLIQVKNISSSQTISLQDINITQGVIALNICGSSSASTVTLTNSNPHSNYLGRLLITSIGCTYSPKITLSTSSETLVSIISPSAQVRITGLGAKKGYFYARSFDIASSGNITGALASLATPTPTTTTFGPLITRSTDYDAAAGLLFANGGTSQGVKFTRILKTALSPL